MGSLPFELLDPSTNVGNELQHGQDPTLGGCEIEGVNQAILDLISSWSQWTGASAGRERASAQRSRCSKFAISVRCRLSWSSIARFR